MNGGLLGLVADYRRMRASGGSLVLATVIETQGSTYRRPGARMLIDMRGEFVGLLSGGCFESDVAAHAQSVIKSGHAKVVEYDMRASADTLWGLGIGCNGAIRILLQRLDEDNGFQPFEHIARAVERGESAATVTIFESDSATPSCQNLLVEDGAEHFHLPALVSDKVVPALNRCRKAGRSELTHVNTSNLALSCFVSVTLPVSDLLILGAGPDALPVVHFAKCLGWRVSVVDHRPVYADGSRLAEADRVLCVDEQRRIDADLLQEADAVLIMSHHFDSDEKYLAQALSSNAAYIGLLGPSERRDQLMESVTCSLDDRQRVYGPVGFDLGAELPEEIALAVLAEIQMVLSGRTGRSLSTLADSIHD